MLGFTCFFYLKKIILVACSIFLLDSAVLNYKLIKDRSSVCFTLAFPQHLTVSGMWDMLNKHSV